MWASTCHLFQFFEWFYQFIAWNDNDNKTNTEPIEPGTNDCDCRYETIILISVSAYNQSQATATDSLNDKINLNFPQNYQLHDFYLFCKIMKRISFGLIASVYRIFCSMCAKKYYEGKSIWENLFSNYLVYNFMRHKILIIILIFRFCFSSIEVEFVINLSIAGCWLFIS